MEARIAEELQPEDPQKVGPYWLLGRLGSGGMGRVFLGRSPGGRMVAVKVVRAEFAEQADFRSRFAREVAAARTVSGMFTAPVVDADLDTPIPWLATAYVPGLSLAETITRHGPLPATSVLALAAGLAEGLGARATMTMTMTATTTVTTTVPTTVTTTVTVTTGSP